MRLHCGFSFPIKKLLPFIGFLFVGLLAFFGIDKITAHALTAVNPNGSSVNAYKPSYANIDESNLNNGGTCSPSNISGCSTRTSLYNSSGCNNQTSNGITYCMFANHNSSNYFSIANGINSGSNYMFSNPYIVQYGYYPQSKLVWKWNQSSVNYCSSGTLKLYYKWRFVTNNTALTTANLCATNLNTVTGSIGYCSNYVTVNGNNYSGTSEGDSTYSVIIPKPTTDLTITIDGIQPFLKTFTPEGQTTSGYYWNYGFAITGYECNATSNNTDSNAIINNASQNTQSIINNQNSNTQSINNNINNSASAIVDSIDDLKEQAEQNNEELIESQKVCKILTRDDVSISGKYLDSNNVVQDGSSYGITDYVRISNSTIKVLQPFGIQNAAAMCFYDSNKVSITCMRINSSTINVPNNAYYFRTTIVLSTNLPQLEICRNGNQAIYDSITDSNVDGSGVGELDGKFDEFGIDDLAKTPLQLLQNIYNSGSNECSPLVLPITIGIATANPSIPCGDQFWSSFPSSAITLYHVLVFGLAAWVIMKRMIKLVEKSLDPDDKSDMVENL